MSHANGPHQSHTEQQALPTGSSLSRAAFFRPQTLANKAQCSKQQQQQVASSVSLFCRRASSSRWWACLSALLLPSHCGAPFVFLDHLSLACSLVLLATHTHIRVVGRRPNCIGRAQVKQTKWSFFNCASERTGGNKAGAVARACTPLADTGAQSAIIHYSAAALRLAEWLAGWR